MKERPKSRSWMVCGENWYGVRLTVNGEQNMEDGGGKEFSLNDAQRAWMKWVAKDWAVVWL